MGSLGGLLGLGGGQSGTGINPAVASGGMAGTSGIINPVDQGQTAAAYTGTQNSMQAQNALLAAMQGQNGLGLQSQAAQGYSNLANGVGPNPAQAQLAQNTAANVAQIGAQMAGQRGAGGNVGLMARQVGQQGAATQQNAVGQAATLQAQQQVQGLQGLAGQGNTIAGQQIGQTNANTGSQQAEQANLINAITGQNNTNVSQASNINNANAGLANTQLQGQQGMIGGLMNTIGGGASNMMGAHGGQVRRYEDGGEVETGGGADIGSPSFASDAGASALSGGIGPKSKSGGGGGGGGGGGMMSMLPMLAAAAAKGGEIMKMADGGGVPAGPQSMFGQFLSNVAGGSASIGSPSFSTSGGAAALAQGAAAASKKGKDALTSSSEGGKTTQSEVGSSDKFTTANTQGNQGEGMDAASTTDTFGSASPGAMMAFKGGMAKDLRTGGKVRAAAGGQAAVKGGDSYSNDKIPAMLSEHEIVLPRSVTMGDDPVGDSAKFVAAVLAKRRGEK